ncbi:hypothetical protein I6A60_07210 [Frankia sp. AgB1.9]|uniref:hypothetical protein n=1 Tax=unclassified Frankia TaxID=2632575 RepID=UPI001931CD6B|nr:MULTISPECIES: hypothetical protein [unclassified Frankia]MBL7488390.1 hypothetical protein [Frankia sp. AgW1.1]MBL7547662.1 hypothetical protein [Frankia sp. AgB1.9]MBL7624093.1 hypothetical protein [Frankia sp. AgB1.8]
MASETPGLDRLVERMMQALSRGVAGVEEPPETLVRAEGAEATAAFLRMADPERTSELIMKMICAMDSIDNPDEVIDFKAQFDRITLHQWESGLQEDATSHLAWLLHAVYQGVLQTSTALFSAYLPDEAGAVFADLWRIASRPETFEDGGLYHELSRIPDGLRDALSLLVSSVAVRLLMSRNGREVTLKWAEAAAQIPPAREEDRGAS